MNLLLLSSALPSPARPSGSAPLLRRAPSPVIVSMDFAEFLRSVLSSRSFNLPAKLARVSSLSHSQVSISPATVKPPPKPPDLRPFFRTLFSIPSLDLSSLLHPPYKPRWSKSCSSPPVTTLMEAAELSTVKLSSTLLNISATPGRESNFSHRLVSHFPAMPVLLTEPPDPPDPWSRSRKLSSTGLVYFEESLPSDRISFSQTTGALPRSENPPLYVSNCVPSASVSSPTKILKTKLLCILTDGNGLFLCSRFGDGFLGRHPVDILKLDLGVNFLILSPLCFSTILQSLANQSFPVLLFAGEGTSGSWIPGFVTLHILNRRCKILGPESSLILFEAPYDICVLLPCDLFQGPIAGMFSSPTVWEWFNISPSSVGTESSLPSYSLFRERTFPHCSLSMKEYLPDSLPVNLASLVTVLFSCVAVRTGPEETIEFIFVMLGGEDCACILLKSLGTVTIPRSFGFAVLVSLTQASLFSILLSIYLRFLSNVFLFVFVFCCNVLRGCLIPSLRCIG